MRARHEVSVALRLLVNNLRIREALHAGVLCEYEGVVVCAIHVLDRDDLLADFRLCARNARGRAIHLTRVASGLAVAAEDLVYLRALLAEDVVERLLEKAAYRVRDGLQSPFGQLVHDAFHDVVDKFLDFAAAGDVVDERREFQVRDGRRYRLRDALLNSLHAVVAELREAVGEGPAGACAVVAYAAGGHEEHCRDVAAVVELVRAANRRIEAPEHILENLRHAAILDAGLGLLVEVRREHHAVRAADHGDAPDRPGGVVGHHLRVPVADDLDHRAADEHDDWHHKGELDENGPARRRNPLLRLLHELPVSSSQPLEHVRYLRFTLWRRRCTARHSIRRGDEYWRRTKDRLARSPGPSARYGSA